MSLRPSSVLPAAGFRTLFCVHGSAVSGKSWNALAAPLRDRVRVLAPDRLGQAAGERWPADRASSFDAEAEHLAATLAAAPGPVHLFGHSYGGAVAMQMALRWPERVARLTLYEPTRFALLFRPGHAPGEAAREILAIGHGTQQRAAAGQEAEAAQLFVDYWSGAGTWAAMDAGRQQRLAVQMPKVGAEFLAAFADPLPLDAWRALAMPVLLLGGETSPAPVRAINALLASVLPRSASVTLPGIGHMGPMTHADDVREWLPEAATIDLPMPMATKEAA
ncbi:MAG: alpha/beta hydrolase [Burkholderiales bacterium]|nr:alpha/beta hydrolase [Burkholderiales bacterium]